jgi:SAM-dependent methyltransferase
MSLDDPAFVRDQYATETKFAARKSAYANIEGPDPWDLTFQAVAETHPARVLEVGGGSGELAERIVREVGAELIGVDQSERMVNIQRSKGIDARVGDVRDLPFAAGEFDVAIAAWMLYHVPDLDRALAELARVLRPGGRLVAVTNGAQHLSELWNLAGRQSPNSTSQFRSENAEERQRRHFEHVERREANGWVTMDNDTVRRYAASWDDLAPVLDLPPFKTPLRIRRVSTVFVAEKPRPSSG